MHHKTPMDNNVDDSLRKGLIRAHYRIVLLYNITAGYCLSSYFVLVFAKKLPQKAVRCHFVIQDPPAPDDPLYCTGSLRFGRHTVRVPVLRTG